MSGDSLGKPVVVHPKPRAVVLGFPDGATQDIASLFPTSVRGLANSPLHPDDWDIAVVGKDEAAHLTGVRFVVAFGTELMNGVEPLPDQSGTSEAGQVNKWGLNESAFVRRGRAVIARDLFVANDLPDYLEALVRADLAVGFETEPKFALEVTRTMGAYGSSVSRIGNPSEFVAPFIVSSDGSILAGRAKRSKGGEVWILPEWISRPQDWVRAAWRFWHEKYEEETIPSPPLWSDQGVWFTPNERATAAAMAAVEDEKREADRVFTERLGRLAEEMARARAAGDAGARRLLTTQGAELVGAVVTVLRGFGFDVTDMDGVHEEGDRREDLRIREEPDYEAIAEVRGYKGGAASNDLQRLARFAGRYAAERSRLPSGQWYIVNELLGRDPSTRPVKALASKPEEVREFAENPGVVVSSVALYRLWQKVEGGEIAKEEGRRLLRECRGYFEI